MILYDTIFEPPAIIIPLTVAGVVRRRPQLEVSALIDTGADITAIPDTFVERLKLYPIGRLQLEDARGAKTPVYTYEAALTMNAGAARRLEVV
jgi:predicted aspartyl protease